MIIDSLHRNDDANGRKTILRFVFYFTEKAIRNMGIMVRRKRKKKFGIPFVVVTHIVKRNNFCFLNLICMIKNFKDVWNAFFVKCREPIFYILCILFPKY